MYGALVLLGVQRHLSQWTRGKFISEKEEL